MGVYKKSFGYMPDGKEVFLYALDNNNGIRAEIINYGGIVKNLWVKKADGEYVDVVLGRDTLEEYLDNTGYIGVAVGRYANRIKYGKFNINDTEYNVSINDGKNSLHGGNIGFDKLVWDVSEGGSEDEPELIMSIVSPDNDQGFPGELKVNMTYKLTKNNAFHINYKAFSDKDTVVNLTNHSYFNLNGIAGSNIYNLNMKLNCDFYTPNTTECMPYGEILSVKNTPFDFTQGKLVGTDIKSENEQIKMFGGYDHNFIIRGRGFREAAVVSSSETGISMLVYTDKPGLQFYSGNAIEEGRRCKNNQMYKVHDALCIETQFFPDSTQYSHFSNPILKAREKYDYTTEYRFIIK